MGVKGDIFDSVGTNGTVTKAETPVAPLPKRDPKDERIEELEGDLRKLQKCVTCVICQDMLFEPYSLKCGHVFCYTCMLDWLGLHKKRTCPECRAVVKGQPAPAYLIRDMIETFVARAELTSPHGAGAELRKQQKEALAAVNRDRATEGIPKGGLFRGMFKSRQKPLRGVRDPEDGVLRCPNCVWEIADGHCAQCRRRVRSPSSHDDDFSDEDDDEDDDDSGSETESQEEAWDDDDDDDGELGLEDLDEERDDWLDNARARRLRRMDQDRFHEFPDGEDEEDDEDEDEDGARDLVGGRNEPITLDDSDPGLEVTYSSRNRVGGAARARRRPPSAVISQAREQRGGRDLEEGIDLEEGEEEDSEDEDEGSLEDFVVHDTPENRRRRPAGNNRDAGGRNGGVVISNNRSFQNAGPMVISSSPSIPAPTRRNSRNIRRTITDTDEEGSSAVSEVSSRPPPFLGEIRHDYNHRRGPIALPSDDDDGEEELLGPGMGYTPLEYTASENEDDDGYSSPPRRGRRKGHHGRSGPGSVFSVPEEEEADEESRGFGDDDESEDQDGDVRMGGQPQRRVRTRASRPQITDDSDSDSDVAPAPRRRRTQAGNYFRTHHHNSNTSTRRQREIVPNILDAFQQHRQAMTERQLDNLFRNSARSATPVQRHYTGGSNRGARSTRESTADSSWEVTPMGQSTPPPPFSPMFQGVSSSPVPMQPRSPGQQPQSSTSPRVGGTVRAGSESSNVWSPLASPQQQQLQSRPPQQQQRQVPITIGSSPQAVRVRTRNSRQQLRGSSSRAGLRVGSITPTPTNPSVGGATGRQSSAGPSAPSLAARSRRGVALTTEDIRARGEAVRRRQQEAAEAANGGLGRRNSRRDLVTGNSNNAPPLGVVGRTVSGLSGRGGRLGAVIGGPLSGGGGGPMLIIGSEDD